MNIFSVCGAALVVTVISTTLRKYVPDYALLISICAGAVVFVILCSALVSPMCRIKDMIERSKMPTEYGLILLKSLGICLVTQFVSDACKDAGESSMAGKVELAGKIAVIVAAMPMFEKVIQVSTGLMGAR